MEKPSYSNDNTFDSDTHRYYREVVWPRQRELEAERNAQAEAERQRKLEEEERSIDQQVRYFKSLGAMAILQQIKLSEKYIQSQEKNISSAEERIELLKMALDELESEGRSGRNNTCHKQ